MFDRKLQKIFDSYLEVIKEEGNKFDFFKSLPALDEILSEDILIQVYLIIKINVPRLLYSSI